MATFDFLEMLTQTLDAHKGTSSATSQSFYARQVRVSLQSLPKGWVAQHFINIEPL